MSFFSQDHKLKIETINQLWNSLHDLQEVARQYGIEDIFQDNGAKVLQQLIYLNFQNIPGREGNDAIDDNRNEWEMKSINLATSAVGFSTNHHTTGEIINKYRKVFWSFAIYRGISLEEIYVMSPEHLEPLFKHWEEQLKKGSHINNPKIPVSFVQQNGIKVYPIDPQAPIDPAQVLINRKDLER